MENYLKTLEVTNDQAYTILGQAAGLYDDNGGDSDGNANFPSDFLECDDVVMAGYGRYEEVAYYDTSDGGLDEALKARGYLDSAHFAELAPEQNDYENLRDALNSANSDNSEIRWSGFSASNVFVVSWKAIR